MKNMAARKLLILQLKENGISKETYSNFSDFEKSMVIEKNGKYYLEESHRKKVRVVLTGGVFDILHIGHIITLEEAKMHGDLLVVAIAKEDMIRKKQREPIHSQEYRQKMVESLKPVDIAICGFEDAYEMIEYVKPAVIVYGYDQQEFLKPQGIEIIKLQKKIDDTKFKTGKILEKFGI